MKNLLCHAMFAIVCCIALLAETPTFAAPSEPNHIRAQVFVEPKELVMHQPLFVRISIENRGQEPIKLAHTITWEVSRDRGWTSLRFHQPDLNGFCLSSLIIIEPKSMADVSQVLFRLNERVHPAEEAEDPLFIFSRPGVYEVNAYAFLDGKKVQIAAEKVYVRLPKSDEDQAAKFLNQFANSRSGKIGGPLFQGLLCEEGFSSLQTIKKGYLNSPFVDFANSRLGWHYVSLCEKEWKPRPTKEARDKMEETSELAWSSFDSISDRSPELRAYSLQGQMFLLRHIEGQERREQLLRQIRVCQKSSPIGSSRLHMLQEWEETLNSLQNPSAKQKKVPDTLLRSTLLRF